MHRMEQARLHNLDAMRGVCAATVVLFHCVGLFAAGTIFCHGYLAVDVFFILSGFVIARTYEGRLGGGLTFAAFARARLKRLGPVYWTGTLLGAAMLVAVAAYRPAGTFYTPALIAGTTALSLALIPQLFVAGLAYPANAVAWSLFGEAVANLVYGRWLYRARTQTLVIVAIAGWAVCAAYSYNNPQGWCFGASIEHLPFVPFKAVPGFLAGVILYRGWRAGWLDRLPSISPLIVFALWVIITEVPTYGPTPTFDLLIVTLAGPLLIALLVRAPEASPRPLLWLGAVSYPLYASHLSLVFLARETPYLGFAHGPDPARAALLVAATLGLAFAVHRLVETRKARTATARPLSA